MIKSLKDLLDKFSRFTNSLVYDGGICKRLKDIKMTRIKRIVIPNTPHHVTQRGVRSMNIF